MRGHNLRELFFTKVLKQEFFRVQFSIWFTATKANLKRFENLQVITLKTFETRFLSKSNDYYKKYKIKALQFILPFLPSKVGI